MIKWWSQISKKLFFLNITAKRNIVVKKKQLMQKTIILIFSVQSSKIKILITLNYFLAEAEGFFSLLWSLYYLRVWE